jgi:uncharacterized membrane protein YphA (DoxX/SURF4 family)
MKELKTVKGRSFIFNILFVAANITGVLLVILGNLELFASSQLSFNLFGVLFFLAGIAGIIIFKGRMMMANVSRALVGSIFIVSGLIKANDPIGFAYKLEEYFEDGALAYRLKEIMGAPDFSFENLIGSALGIGIVICILEIIIGVLLLIGGKIKLTAWSAMVMMLFFTFLTWHTATCDPTKSFTDRNVYDVNSDTAKELLKVAKKNKEVVIVEKNATSIVVDEQAHPQCVSDCGCFGDAFKGSAGRSLTPSESLAKDFFLLYLVVWIFLAQWIIQPNKARQNIKFLLWSLGIVGFLSILFSWYFPLLFTIMVFIGALWVLRVGGAFFSNYWGSILSVTFIAGIFILYVMNFDPVKDFRPYAVGNNLKWQMNNGINGKYENTFILKNRKTGQEKAYSEKDYMDDELLWNDKFFKFVRSEQKVIIAAKLPSITEQFNPEVKVKDLTEAELGLDYVQGIKENMLPSLKEISIREFIVKTNRIVIVSARDLKTANWTRLQRFKDLQTFCALNKIPFVLITSSSPASINYFRKSNNWSVASFVNDETELKAISRSNPCLLVVENGIVKAKFAHLQTPSIERFKKEIDF